MKTTLEQQTTLDTMEALATRQITSSQVHINKELEAAIAQSWARIAPFWPLKNLIATNPLAGFEDLPFEQALIQGQAYFQQEELPGGMQTVNRHTIKWLQLFFDQGQATIQMPQRERGLLAAVRALLPFDKAVRPADAKTQAWMGLLPQAPMGVIAACLQQLAIPAEHQAQFLTLMLTTLPGWAAHIQYRTSWADAQDAHHPHPVSQTEYLAVRLLLTCLAWPGAKALLTYHEIALQNAQGQGLASTLASREKAYRTQLLGSLAGRPVAPGATPAAQLVFCIDVRSEPFRRALEAQGAYETFGFAGFFGVPVHIEDRVTGESYASCPVLLKPSCQSHLEPTAGAEAYTRTDKRNRGLKRLYQSLKYTFSTPFALVETLGPLSGLAMACRTLAPKAFAHLEAATSPAYDLEPSLAAIPLDQQCAFASGALGAMGLTRGFAPLVVLCGHGSQTTNNAYATSLDCGACGGRHGAPNARLLAAILNQTTVRKTLAGMGIAIPDYTYFLGAEHNTTTDELNLYANQVPATHQAGLAALRQDLHQARLQNTQERAAHMGQHLTEGQAAEHLAGRARDWAQVRPEWGLARNAAFIVAPRALTHGLDLEGRTFLHSYDYAQDPEAKALTVILTAPMVVAQWINAQYLFSTLDNVAYGGGSKVSKNITGKVGIMQGNASDLMHGLPLQSVYSTDTQAYHQAQRLMTIVYAPPQMIDSVITAQPILQRLFGNGWVSLVCIDPETGQPLLLDRTLTWAAAS